MEKIKRNNRKTQKNKRLQVLLDNAIGFMKEQGMQSEEIFGYLGTSGEEIDELGLEV